MLTLLLLLQMPLPEVELRPGLVITSSVRIVPKTYRLPAPASLDSAVVTIRGDGILVDFGGAVMEGLDPAADPDRATGVAVRIEGGRQVRVINARIRGYRVGILARDTRNLHLADNDLSHTWKPRLYSLVEHESLVDWLSYHQNDANEWLRFGTAVYLDGVEGGTIRGNRAEQGMNGLLMTRTSHLRVENNTFRFNSGLGIGLYRSSDNVIVRNRLDYNVRGYSHGFYQRGQDSAGLLLYEQSARNVVAFNSATHSGDGLFLWAGETTMHTGEGGANDNVFHANDFSFAPTNAMEATFSRNTFTANRATGSTYGLWGGYSWESNVIGNCFAANRFAVAIEHGQDNLITANAFHGDSVAVRLWAREQEPADWGYTQHRDTRSRNTRITDNAFVGNRVGVRGLRTRDLTVTGNVWAGVDSTLMLEDTAYVTADRNVTATVNDSDEDHCPVPAGVPTSPLARRDRRAMIVDAWGPYDWRSPRLWPLDSTRAVPLRLAVLGPPGPWRVAERRGIAALSASEGRTGDTIAVTPAGGNGADWELTLAYRGEETVSPRGERRAAGEPVRFSYERFEPAAEWTLRFFRWDSAPAFTDEPFLTRTEPRLDYMWYRPTVSGIPPDHWALEATAALSLPAGDYTLRTISDDGIRVWMDGRLMIDHWEAHGSAVDTTPLSGGTHEIRVQYYQRDGWTELRLDIVRGREAAGGSPGPH